MNVLLQDSSYKRIRITLAITLLVVLLFYISCLVLFVCDGLIQEIPHVDIEAYPENIDYGILSETQRETFDAILYAFENEELVISCPKYSAKEQHEIITQLGLYFGTMERVERLILWSGNNVYLNLQIFDEFVNDKVIIDSRVDEAVSTLREGSDRYKLWQISNYLSTKIVYTDGCRSTITALNGKGVCNSYAMLFYKMATRLGIKNYICYGYANNDYHAWNMVELNGEYIYYDITWYDAAVRNIEYLYSQTSWDRKFQINNEWHTDLD